ncbi:MAG: hypothetical protein AB8B65_07090 [Kordia sp.]|uniref:hypothetical protein n=1 Tax=Kordia sp. TaxID=1965332 RepID=UPI003858A3BC
MNSYNENLHSSVVSSLNEQELELQKVKSQQDASMFSLYYAQGDRITTAEKLEVINRKYLFQQKVHEQAITDSDLSTNVLASSENVKTYTAKSVSNTAVAAANVQIAANAILKLTSDAGSIFSIVSAADFGTEIYTQSKNAYDLMNVTAYTAEKTSQHSMEASQLIAEVPSNTLADKATSTDAAVKNLLTVTSSQFEATTQELSTENEKLATSNTNEKKAEGVLEDTSVAYNATFEAYRLNNSELNLGLHVHVPKSVGDATNYTVSFLPYTSPFTKDENGNIIANSSAPTSGYPVDDYYIMLVKDSKSDTFSVNNAEDIVDKGDRSKFYQVSPKTKNLTETTEENHVLIDFSSFTAPIKQKIYTSQLLDTDGDAMNLGDEYVVVVFAVLDNSYKKIINTFDDYMTAPSRRFSLENRLNAVSANNIKATGGGSEEVITISDNTNTGDITIDGEEMIAVEKITFKVLENPDYEVVYHGLFLPDNTNLIKGLLTVEGLMNLETETNLLEDIADKYDPQIEAAKEKINSLNSEISGLDTEINEDSKIIADPTTSASKKKKAEAQKAKAEAERGKKSKVLTTEKAHLKQLEKEQKKEVKNATRLKHIKPGFFFNLTTAEQIPAGSYTPIVRSEADSTKAIFDYLINEATVDWEKWKKNNWDTVDKAILLEKLEIVINDLEKLEFKHFVDDVIDLLITTLNIVIEELEKLFYDFSDFINDLGLVHSGYKLYTMEFEIKPETTDNFGNRLINKNKYIPAIVTVSNNTATINKQFTNALSDFQHTKTFRYIDPTTNATY